MEPSSSSSFALELFHPMYSQQQAPTAQAPFTPQWCSSSIPPAPTLGCDGRWQTQHHAQHLGAGSMHQPHALSSLPRLRPWSWQGVWACCYSQVEQSCCFSTQSPCCLGGPVFSSVCSPYHLQGTHLEKGVGGGGWLLVAKRSCFEVHRCQARAMLDMETAEGNKVSHILLRWRKL